MRGVIGVVTLLACARGAEAGATFELDMGGGAEIGVARDGRLYPDGALVMPAIALGGWYGDRLTLTGRLALMHADGMTFVFVGPSAQFFPTRHFFVGGGLGLAGVEFDEPINENITGFNGFGLDLRAGLNLRPEARHCLTLSVEVTPQIYRDDFTVGIALLAGYQYL